MVRRILLIFLTLTVPALNGMWCFDGPVRDAYDTYGAIIRGVQKNEKVLKTPTYQLLAAAAPLVSKSFPRFFERSFLRKFLRRCQGKINLLSSRVLQKTIAIFQPFFCNKKRILQNIQNRLTVSLPLLNSKAKHENLQMEAHIIAKIIHTESKHPGYQSFFHGADGKIAMLFKLQEKLYAKYHGKKPIDFEFLRARGTRKNLTGIIRDDYVKKIMPWDTDEKMSLRAELLSVAYAPWSRPLSLFSKNDSVFDLSDLTMGKFFEEILAAYNLPMPRKFVWIPKISHGLFLHILIKNNTADRIVYNSKACGHPNVKIAIPDTIDAKRFDGQARIILDPTVFDTPSDEVKIIRHQQLSDEEQKEIDTFCDYLIAQAEKLKAEQEKDGK